MKEGDAHVQGSRQLCNRCRRSLRRSSSARRARHQAAFCALVSRSPSPRMLPALSCMMASSSSAALLPPSCYSFASSLSESSHWFLVTLISIELECVARMIPQTLGRAERPSSASWPLSHSTCPATSHAPIESDGDAKAHESVMVSTRHVGESARVGVPAA